MQVFNAATQQMEDVKWELSRDHEFVARFEDGSFLKFPAGLTKEQLQEEVDKVKEANEGQEVITPEVLAQQEEAKSLVDELNGVDNVPEEPKE